MIVQSGDNQPLAFCSEKWVQDSKQSENQKWFVSRRNICKGWEKTKTRYLSSFQLSSLCIGCCTTGKFEQDSMLGSKIKGWHVPGTFSETCKKCGTGSEYSNWSRFAAVPPSFRWWFHNCAKHESQKNSCELGRIGNKAKIVSNEWTIHATGRMAKSTDQHLTSVNIEHHGLALWRCNNQKRNESKKQAWSDEVKQGRGSRQGRMPPCDRNHCSLGEWQRKENLKWW